MSTIDKAWIQRMIADSEEVQRQDKLILAATGPVRCESVPVSPASPRTAQDRTQTAMNRTKATEQETEHATPGVIGGRQCTI